MQSNAAHSDGKILIFGRGWIGTMLGERMGVPVLGADIADMSAVERALDEHRPRAVINAAGKTGKPNVDWCEDHKEETVRSNTTGPLVLMDACLRRGVFFAHLSSGCIFDGASPGPGGFTEEDAPNPVSFYGWTKAMADEVLRRFPVLIMRLRMPIDGTPSPRNLITKLAGYRSVIDVENSVTVVDDLLTAVAELVARRKTGIYNVANPEPVRHRDIMRWYAEIVDPGHAYELIGADELARRGLAKARRSNCILDTSKLRREGIRMTPTEEAIKNCLRRYKKALDSQ